MKPYLKHLASVKSVRKASSAYCGQFQTDGFEQAISPVLAGRESSESSPD